jgi:hypothetical protein
MQAEREINSKFQTICLNATKAFKTIDSLRIILNNLKSTPNSNETEYLKLDSQLFNDIKTQLESLSKNSSQINRKKSLKIVFKRIQRRKKLRRKSDEQMYTKKLFDFVKSQKLFGSLETLPTKMPIKQDNIDLDIREVDNKILKLNDLKEFGTLLTKIIEVRSKNRLANHLSDTHSNNVEKLNNLLQCVESRRKKYQSERNSFKKKSHLNDQESVFSEKLSLAEARIKGNLFGPIASAKDDIRKLNYFELFYRQAEISVNNLVMIRQEWDNFLSSSANAQSIPIRWVPLERPHDNQWAQFIKEDA